MISNIKTICLNGLTGYIVNVQVDVSKGIPAFDIVGLAGTSIKESKERVKTAIKNSNFKIPSRKIVINLAPANKRKDGSLMDLPIAIGILKSEELIKKVNLDNFAFVGELSLGGEINALNGAIPICYELKRPGIKNVIIPYDNLNETSLLSGINIYGAKNLIEVVNFFNYGEIPKKSKSIKIETNKRKDVDFSEIKGQENAKRAIEIACAGGHNILMCGPPGVGKTMIAKRISTILPDLQLDEILDVMKIYSLAGLLKNKSNIINERPFRMPHHTISLPSFIGGGHYPIPGEISLAHLGVLFMDELPEFNKKF